MQDAVCNTGILFSKSHPHNTWWALQSVTWPHIKTVATSLTKLVLCYLLVPSDMIFFTLLFTLLTLDLATFHYKFLLFINNIQKGLELAKKKKERANKNRISIVISWQGDWALFTLGNVHYTLAMWLFIFLLFFCIVII